MVAGTPVLTEQSFTAYEPQTESLPSHPASSVRGAAAQLIVGNPSLLVAAKMLTMTKAFQIKLGAFSGLRCAEFLCNDTSEEEEGFTA